MQSKHLTTALNSVYSFVLLSAIVPAAALLNASPVAACSSFDKHPCAPKLSRLFHHRYSGPDLYVVDLGRVKPLPHKQAFAVFAPRSVKAVICTRP